VNQYRKTERHFCALSERFSPVQNHFILFQNLFILFRRYSRAIPTSIFPARVRWHWHRTGQDRTGWNRIGTGAFWFLKAFFL
jgi:hypothetical protein